MMSFDLLLHWFKIHRFSERQSLWKPWGNPPVARFSMTNQQLGRSWGSPQKFFKSSFEKKRFRWIFRSFSMKIQISALVGGG
jgi:hypothetical protein